MQQAQPRYQLTDPEVTGLLQFFSFRLHKGIGCKTFHAAHGFKVEDAGRHPMAAG
jgi:hypothetical protein